jgi:RecA/RadA recombinase
MDLRGENKKLREEVRDMRQEIKDMRKVISNMRGKIIMFNNYCCNGVSLISINLTQSIFFY